MKIFTAVLMFVVLAAVHAGPNPLFGHGHVRYHRYHSYHPVVVREYVKVPEVHVQKVVHTVPVYVVKPVVQHVPVVVPAVTTERPVHVEVGGGVNVAANPGAVHVTKTKPVVVSV
uniref:Uncharacterized protein n=1 Tax=Anopheles dirus TaxID=7168 RepID=A0A182NUT3_9DIPT